MVLNTKIIDENQLIKLWNRANFKVTVDGGTNRWFEIVKKNPNIEDKSVPDLISGDLDSVSKDVLEHYKSKCEIVETPDQDFTDFTKAVRIVASKQIKVDYIVAFSEHSGRLDQIFGNLETLYEVQDIGVPVVIVSSHSIEWLLNPGEHTVHLPQPHQGLHCGLIPLGQSCTNISTQGLKWNLNPQDILAFGKLVSTSNRFEKDAKKVTIKTETHLLFTMEVVPTET